MSADELIKYLSWAIYALIFVGVTFKAVRRPLRANVDIALLFAGPAVIIVINTLTGLRVIPAGQIVTIVNVSAILLMAYMLLRLVDDFTNVPTWIIRSASLVPVLLVIATVVLTPAPPAVFPPWLSLLIVAYLIVTLLYSTLGFIREAYKSSGVTKRRMRAVATGSLWLCITLLISGLGARFFPDLAGLWTSVGDLAGLGSAVGYYLGFATPGLLRRAWQEPDLRAFLGHAASLPRLSDTDSILREMERGASASLGAPNAAIGLWDNDSQCLRFSVEGGSIEIRPQEGTVSARAFLTQKAIFTDNIQRDNAQTVHSSLSRLHGITALLAAPITAGEKRLGVLTVYAPHAPIFADEDLALVQLLADQAAVILESRALIDEAARVRVREEVTRLKDDFLSAAAHDLKTPLTTLIGQSQLMERRALRDPDAPADLVSIRKVAREAQRLKNLVLELLDAARAEQGRLVGEREEVDLAAIAQETCARHSTERHDCEVDVQGQVPGMYDATRIEQLVENLVENAFKYSPEGGRVHIRVWSEGDWNHLTVTDEGIGIPATDLPHIFDRFHRASNVNDRSFAGMGLGLFICKGIVEEHGGHITVESKAEQGSTFHVTLPALAHIPDQHQSPGNDTLVTVGGIHTANG